MSDCNEALVKIKMAFRPGVMSKGAGADGGGDANLMTGGGDNVNVSGFGEFGAVGQVRMRAPEEDRSVTSGR